MLPSVEPLEPCEKIRECTELLNVVKYVERM